MEVEFFNPEKSVTEPVKVETIQLTNEPDDN